MPSSQVFNSLHLLQDMQKLQKAFSEGLQQFQSIKESDIEIGTSPKQAVYQEDKVILYRYQARRGDAWKKPVLLCYALVNRPAILDFSPEVSFVRGLLDAGLDVYLIDWGYPGPEDRYLSLEDFVLGYLHNCVSYILQENRLKALHLVGVCQGGVLSLAYAALYPQNICSLISMVTPVDFHEPESLLALWTGAGDRKALMNLDALVESFGNLPGDVMNLGFLMLKPAELTLQKYFHAITFMSDEQKFLNFLRMEKWIFDSPDQIGEVWREFLLKMYQKNQLIKGTLKIGKLVDLKKIKVPVLNIVAAKDHLVPPGSSAALERYIRSKDYSFKSFETGHIGLFVSKRVHKELTSTISDWLIKRMR